MSSLDIQRTRITLTDPAVAGEWEWYGVEGLLAQGTALLGKVVDGGPAAFDDHWEASPLLSACASRELAAIFGVDELDRLLCEAPLRAGDVRVVADGQRKEVERRQMHPDDVAGQPEAEHEALDLGSVLAWIADGASICFHHIHRRSPAVRATCNALAVVLGHNVHANAYLTPARSRGFDRHYDTHDVLVLQTHGSKRWVVEAAEIVHPLVSQRGRNDTFRSRPERDVVLEAELSPGDCLYIPRGFVHSARADETPSLHVTFGIRPITLESMLRSQLHAAAGDVPSLRRTMPRELAHAPAFTALQPLVDLIHGVRFDGESVLLSARERFWAGFNVPLEGRLAEALGLLPVTSETVVSRRPGVVFRVQVDGDRLHLRFGDCELSMPAQWHTLVTCLLQDGSRTVSDACDGSDEVHGVSVISTLLREGVLVRDRGSAA